MNQNNLKKHGTTKFNLWYCVSTQSLLKLSFTISGWLLMSLLTLSTWNTSWEMVNIDKALLNCWLNKYHTDKTTTLPWRKKHWPTILVGVPGCNTRQQFAYIAHLESKTPVFPSVANASSWEAECASKVLRHMTRQQVEKGDVLPLPARRQGKKVWKNDQKRQPDTGKLLSMPIWLARGLIEWSAWSQSSKGGWERFGFSILSFLIGHKCDKIKIHEIGFVWFPSYLCRSWCSTLLQPHSIYIQ